MSFDVLKYSAVSVPSFSYDKPVVGLDRDGVINYNISEGNVWKKEDFVPIPGSLEAITMIRSKGYKIVIITNQGGIENKKYTVSDVDSLHQYMFELLGKAGCPSIDGLYYSASLNKSDPYVKPNIGMFKRCEDEHSNIRFNEGWYVGDTIADLKASIKVGAKPILVRTGHGNLTEDNINNFTYRDIKKKVTIYDNLLEFASSLP